MVGKQIISDMNEHFSTYVLKKACRLSIYMKRRIYEEIDTEKEDIKPKQKRNGSLSPPKMSKKWPF